MAAHAVADSPSPPHQGFQLWFGIPDGILVLRPIEYGAFVLIHHERERPAVFREVEDDAAEYLSDTMHSKLLDILR